MTSPNTKPLRKPETRSWSGCCRVDDLRRPDPHQSRDQPYEQAAYERPDPRG